MVLDHVAHVEEGGFRARPGVRGGVGEGGVGQGHEVGGEGDEGCVLGEVEGVEGCAAEGGGGGEGRGWGGRGGGEGGLGAVVRWVGERSGG